MGMLVETIEREQLKREEQCNAGAVYVDGDQFDWSHRMFFVTFLLEVVRSDMGDSAVGATQRLPIRFLHQALTVDEDYPATQFLELFRAMLILAPSSHRDE